MTTTFDDLFGTLRFRSDAERTTFKEMFDLYMSDIPENFSKNQFELAKTYPGTGFEDWALFLQHQPFEKWKSTQISIMANTETDKALSGGDFTNKEAVSVLKTRTEILANENVENKPIIIVMPESLYFKDNNS